MKKRTILSSAWLAGLLAILPLSAMAADAWPSRPLRIVAPILPGSFTDVAARLIAAELSVQLGQQVVVENRPGAGITIGADIVAKAPADGYTMLFTENSFTISPALYPKLPYDPVKSFAPVTIVAEAPTLMWARPDLPAKAPAELVSLARSTPQLLSFASGGQGTSSHLAAELFFDVADIKVVHIPFKGVAASMSEAMSGRVDFGTSSIASAMPHIKSGRLGAIAVTGKERNPMLPEVPTFAESGYPQYDAPIWFGLLLPAGVPPDVVSKLRRELGVALQKPKIREAFSAQGARLMDVSPDAFGKRIEAEIAQWRGLVQRKGIKVE